MIEVGSKIRFERNKKTYEGEVIRITKKCYYVDVGEKKWWVKKKDVVEIEENKGDILYKTLLKVIETKSIKFVSNELNIVVGTINRWITNKKVPIQYQFELDKLNNNKINYKNYSYKDKDQFFTSSEISLYCYNKFLEIMKKNKINLNKYIYIEPSAGDGSFTKILPKNSINMDIEPRNIDIIQRDFLDWMPENNKNKYITFGNPPFGLRGNLALRFINHSAKFSDHLCFLLPPLFESDGKGSPRKRINEYNLIYSEKITTLFKYPDGNRIKINVVLQIWSKIITNNIYKLNKINNKSFSIYSLSDGELPGSTRNKKFLNKCDVYLPSTCFGKNEMKLYDKFDDLPKKRGYGIIFLKNKKEMIEKSKKIIWHNIAFQSTNSSYNLRTSIISNAIS